MSHPSLTTFVRRALKPYVAARKPAALVLAVSGGPDSMALLSASAFCKLGVRLVACGVDHGLRPEAARELDLAEAWAKQAEIPFERVCVQVARTGNMQTQARRARYRALAEVAARVGATAVVTGHHADDQAETVLLRLLRGTSLRGLAAMRAQSTVPGASAIDLLRPMLAARRADVALHIERHGLAVAQDPSNRNPRFLRVRVRHELLPLLEQLNPGVVKHLLALTQQAQRLNMNGELSPILGLRGVHIKALEALSSKGPGAYVLLPGGLVVQRDRDHVKDRKSKPRRAPRITLDSPPDPE